MEIILKYFKNLSENQIQQFYKLRSLYQDWNLKINVVSRKDIEYLYLHHTLHSLGIAKVIEFNSDAKIMDLGTGGGFPGIPLAILFPKTQFHLIDSIGKKIRVVNSVVEGLSLKNVETTNGRVEEVQDKYDFIIGRAVAKIDTLLYWTKGKINQKQNHKLNNGILYLSGGNLSEETEKYNTTTYSLSNYFDEPFFQTKKLVHVFKE